MSPSPDPLLSMRAAVLLLLGFVVGTVAGGLNYLATLGVANSVLVGGGAASAALVLCHRLVGR